MKIQKLLLLASSMLLLTSCGNKDNSSANEDSEKSETTGETSGDDNQIEFRDYDGFELYTQSYSQDVSYGYEVDGTTFAIMLTGQYWAIYNTN